MQKGGRVIGVHLKVERGPRTITRPCFYEWIIVDNGALSAVGTKIIKRTKNSSSVKSEIRSRLESGELELRRALALYRPEDPGTPAQLQPIIPAAATGK